MKALRINPQSYELEAECACLSGDSGTASAVLTFGGASLEMCLLATDAKKLSVWFGKLSKEIDIAEKKYGKANS